MQIELWKEKQLQLANRDRIRHFNRNDDSVIFKEVVKQIISDELESYRFPEIGIVSSVDAKNMRIKCILPHHLADIGGERETKWIKVYSVGASNDEGVVKVPRLGDEVLVIFKYGEVNCALSSLQGWGDKCKAPQTHEEIQYGDQFIKNAGSWTRIEPSGNIEFYHKDKIQGYIGSSFIRFIAPELGDIDEVKTPYNPIGNNTVGIQRKEERFDEDEPSVSRGSWVRVENINQTERWDDYWKVKFNTTRKLCYGEMKDYTKPSCSDYERSMHRTIRRVLIQTNSIAVPKFAGSVKSVNLYKDHYWYDIPHNMDAWEYKPVKTFWEHKIWNISINLEVPCINSFKQINSEYTSETHIENIFKGYTARAWWVGGPIPDIGNFTGTLAEGRINEIVNELTEDTGENFKESDNWGIQWQT